MQLIEVMGYLQALQVEQLQQVEDKLYIPLQQVEHSQWLQVVQLIQIFSCFSN